MQYYRLAEHAKYGRYGLVVAETQFFSFPFHERPILQPVGNIDRYAFEVLVRNHNTKANQRYLFGRSTDVYQLIAALNTNPNLKVQDCDNLCRGDNLMLVVRDYSIIIKKLQNASRK